MNQFFEQLRREYKTTYIEQKQWEQSLVDEEYMENGILVNCFHCMEDTSTITIIDGVKNILEYLEKKIQTSDILFAHYFEFAMDWLYTAKDTLEIDRVLRYQKIQGLVCSNCGALLGFRIGTENVYPYFGYLDDEASITLFEQAFNDECNINHNKIDNYNYNNYKINEDNYKIKENIYKEDYKNFKKVSLLKRLDNNKNILENILNSSKKEDPDTIISILKTTMSALAELNSILEEEDKEGSY